MQIEFIHGKIPTQHMTPVLRPSIQIKKDSAKKPFHKKKMDTSGRATEEGSLSSTDRHAIDVECTEKTNIVKLQYGQSG